MLEPNKNRIRHCCGLKLGGPCLKRKRASLLRVATRRTCAARACPARACAARTCASTNAGVWIGHISVAVLVPPCVDVTVICGTVVMVLLVKLQLPVLGLTITGGLGGRPLPVIVTVAAI